jgi:decaprenylphospho-beta-D-ribofuranose 2-oxidase
MNSFKTISGWGGYPKTNSEVISPRNIDEYKINLKKTFIARGRGRSYGDSANYKTVLQTSFLDKIIHFDKINGLITCEAGITIKKILENIVPTGWFIPVSPGTSFATLGGSIASDVHGKNHHRSGSFGEHVKDIKIMLGNGNIENISTENNSDLFYATCGGMGLTGVILSATIKLISIKSSQIIQTELKSKSLEDTCSIFEENDKAQYSVAWLDCFAKEKSIGKGIITLGEHSEKGNLNFNIKRKVNISKNFPSFVLNKYSISIFNKLYYAYHKNNRKRLVHLFDYFYPLDKINNWNRLYGKNGFIQYQFVIPNDQIVNNLKLIFKKISEFGISPFLSVLKKFGKQNDNLLSFPMSGYTLAMDIKIDKKLFKSIQELDKIVIDLGGRIYLTKDSLMKEETFKNSYLKWEQFEKIREKYGAVSKFRSDQSLRLGLK